MKKEEIEMIIVEAFNAGSKSAFSSTFFADRSKYVEKALSLLSNKEEEKNCPCCATGSFAFPNCEYCYGTGVIQDIECFVSVPWCYKCDPVQAGRTITTGHAKYKCRCGHTYEVPTPVQEEEKAGIKYRGGFKVSVDK